MEYHNLCWKFSHKLAYFNPKKIIIMMIVGGSDLVLNMIMLIGTKTSSNMIKTKVRIEI